MIITIVLMMAVLAVLLCWNLIEVHRTRGTKLLLYIMIPIVLTFPIVTYNILQSQLGYPTHAEEDLAEHEWMLVGAAITQKTIFATVWLKGDEEPRLYAIEATEQNRRAFAKANAQAQEGAAMKGKMAKNLNPGTNSYESEFEFHEFTVQERMPKDVPEGQVH